MVNKQWAKVAPPLSSPVVRCIEKQNFTAMTPIQAAVIPLVLSCKDVVSEAVTGSGKTLAFVVPMIEMLLKKERDAGDAPLRKDFVYSIVISPTRELATQISKVIELFLQEPELSHYTVALLVGGRPIELDEASLRRGAHIIVCTPGRIQDLLSERKKLNLAGRMKELEFLVLDEADRLLDLGFSQTLAAVLQCLPRQRRTGLFSATQTKELQDLVRAGLRNPVAVSVRERAQVSTPARLDNYYVVVPARDKFLVLLNFIRNRPGSKGILFLPTCACVEYWARVLPSVLSARVLSVHGRRGAAARAQAVDAFRAADQAVLLCTDLMARGLDIPHVEWVLHWEPPLSPAALVHRAGRAARAGADGASLLPLLPSEEPYVDFIRANQKMELRDWREAGEEITITDKLRKKVLSTLRGTQRGDRAALDAGQRAFVSHMRAYTKHECNLLLQFKELPLGEIAASYGLLKLPRMPELTEEHRRQFPPADPGLDLNTIPYKDKQKEASRQRKLDEYRRTGAWPAKKKKRRVQSQPWEQAKQNKQDKKLRKTKRREQRSSAASAAPGAAAPRRRRRGDVTEAELRELAEDVALIKRLKKRKITSEQFDHAFGE